MKHILITTIVAVLLVGCGESQQSSLSSETQPAGPGAEVVNSESPTSNTEKWEIKTSSGKIPEGWEPYVYDSNDEFDPFLLRRRTSGNWDNEQKWEIKTSSGRIPEGWEPYAYDSNDEQDPFLLRRRTSGNWDDKQKWEVKTSSGSVSEGWEPFGYDSNDEQDPFLLRRRIN
ncbi:MAG: hypothetical protein QGF56_07175 [Verrucomicrobiota bacterium]|nr:hypothetical protein [Verrucomicrobiota bacterium]